MFASKDLFLTQPAGAATGYQISRSVRLRSSASAYFNKTLTTPTNNKIWTWSAWVKKGTLTSDMYLVTANGTTAYEFIKLSNSSSDNFEYAYWNGSAYSYQIRSTLVLRDPSAWYHIVLQVDTTQATASNRVRMYVNNVEVTSFSISSYPAQNTNTQINSAIATRIGGGFAGNYFDGYLTEINFIDGQALTPSSFGATSTTTGVWGPAKYTGTYGTNGFYLNFSDNSAATAAAIGKDSSGNGNNWTPNNISVTTGTTYDSMVDTPTPYGSDTGVGGEVRGNYAVINPLFKNSSLSVTNGNLSIPVQTISGTNYGAGGTLGVSSGKWYFEMQINASSAGSNDSSVGICKPTDAITNTAAGTGNMIGFMLSLANGVSVNYGTTTAVTGLTSLATNLIQVALDVDAGKVWFGADGVWANSGNPSTGANATYSSGIAGNTWVPAFYYWGVGTSSRSINANFGQRAFSYTAPSGYKALNTQNLSTPTIANGASYMAATLYTGTGANATITNTVGSASFKPDWVWIKSRSNIANHALFDAIRGTGNVLQSNTTAAEATDNTTLTAFNSNGFSLGAAAGSYVVNTNTYTFVAWQWLAGAGSSSSNTNGSITSTVSVNTTAGFSVVTYTGTGSAATVGHGLGVAPKMIIVKRRNSTGSWPVYHASLPSANYELFLERTDAQGTPSNSWNSTAPTLNVFSIGTGTAVNTNTGTYVAYLWAAVAGYSAFGSYTGNGSADGTFVYTGFRPRYLMVKRTDTTGHWNIVDTSRSTYNVANVYLFADASTAESTFTFGDFLSNGIKLRDNSSDWNASGGTYIYAAFAENPFKYALAR